MTYLTTEVCNWSHLTYEFRVVSRCDEICAEPLTSNVIAIDTHVSGNRSSNGRMSPLESARDDALLSTSPRRDRLREYSK